MKRAIMLTGCLLVVALTTFGQSKYSKSFSGSGKKTVKLEIQGSSLDIKGHSGNEVVIESDYEEDTPERAKGLRPLGRNAVDNTGTGMSVTESNNVMTISQATLQAAEYKIKVPKEVHLVIADAGWSGDPINVTDVTGEIEISTMVSEVKLTNVTGPIIANTTSSDITVVFSELSQKGPSSISNVSGAVDLTIPASSKATFAMNTISGEVFTDLDIKLKEPEGQNDNLVRLGGKQNMNGKLNGGGVEVNLNAISGNVYLRKK